MLDAIHDTLTDIASLVESPSFRDEQEHFYRRFAHEFDAGDNSTENKLAYTQIQMATASVFTIGVFATARDASAIAERGLWAGFDGSAMCAVASSAMGGS